MAVRRQSQVRQQVACLTLTRLTLYKRILDFLVVRLREEQGKTIDLAVSLACFLFAVLLHIILM